MPSSVPIPFESKYQPGGKVTIVHGKLTGILHSNLKNPKGLWTSIRLYRANADPVFIINSYIPCTQSNPCVLTYQHQIYQDMSHLKSTTEVHQECWKDLETFINERTNDGMSIILGMDANASPEDPIIIVSKLKASCNLEDPIK